MLKLRVFLPLIFPIICTWPAQGQPNPYYAALLNDSLWFYEAQRSGVLPPDKRVLWRNDSALQDGENYGVDLTGGYYDSGDYAKLTALLAHTLTWVAWAAIEWTDGYLYANQTSQLADMLWWGINWLVKAHPNETLYVQVGAVNSYWGPDTGIPGARPVYLSDPTDDITPAQTAAAFASTALYFYETDGNDSVHGELVAHARSLYGLAEMRQRQQQHAHNWLTWASLWLYRATGDAVFLAKALIYYQDPVGVNSIAEGAVFVLGAKVLDELYDEEGIDTRMVKFASAADRFFQEVLQNDNVCKHTPGGLLWCFPDQSSGDTGLVDALNVAFLILMYDYAPGNAFAMEQLDYVLGDNPMRTPYVCGVHANSPRHPHHPATAIGETLYGAVVRGPDADDKFYDELNDDTQNRVALEYNAAFQGLLAYRLAQGTSDPPPYVSITEPRPNISRPTPGETSVAAWVIVLIVVVIVLCIGGALAGVYLVRKRRQAGESRLTQLY